MIEKLDRERAQNLELTTAKQASEKKLSDQLERERAQNLELTTAKQESEKKFSDQLDRERALNRDLTAAKQASEKKLSEQLDGERARIDQLNTAKTEAEAQLTKLLQKVAEKEAELVAVQEELLALVAALKVERDDLKQQLQSKSAQVDDDLSQLQQQLAIKESDLESVKEENSVLVAEREDLKAELDDLKGQLQIKNAQVEDLSQLASTRGEEREELAKKGEELSTEAEQLQERLLEVQQIRADLIENVEAKQFEINQLAAEMALQRESIEKLTKENEDLKVEVACAEENVAELVGAGPNALVLNQPTGAPPAERDEPPTQPPTQAAIVDKAAYDALLQAYESLETSFADSKKSNKELAMKQQQAQIKSDELVARLDQARQKYEMLAKENHDLRKRSRSPLPPQSNKPVDRQVKEMESINKQLVESCEVATQQLSARKEEMKQQQARIDQLERELAQAKQELEDVQDKHDEVVHTKTEALDRQQAVLDEKLREVVELQGVNQTLEREKGKLETTVQQLRSQLTALKAAATTTDRTCPVCQTKFPGRISQQDYERHVQGHFE